MDFSLKEPHLFSLMFRSNLPHFNHPSLRRAADDDAREGKPPDFDEGMRMTAAWSLMHGLSSLIIDGQLDTIAQRITPPTELATLIDAVLAHWGRTPPTP